MKKYLVLLVSGAVTFVFLLVSYLQSQSPLIKNHEEVLKLFLIAKQVEANLEKDLLKSRDFLSQSYDNLVKDERAIDQICDDLQSQKFGLYGLTSELDSEITNYCQNLETNLRHVEDFKMQNAILRNSLSYIRKIATDNIFNFSKRFQSKTTRAHSNVMEMALLFAMTSSSMARSNLESMISEIKKYDFKRDTKDVELTVSHALHIQNSKEKIDSVIGLIAQSKGAEKLENIRNLYFKIYEKEEDDTFFYRKILFSFSLIFLAIVLSAIDLIWRQSRQLAVANSTLEQKVVERTQELQLKQDVILQQQQALISSAKMSSLGEMAGGIAHEINTPLATINLRVEQLLGALEDDSLDICESVDGLQAIQSTADRIGKIVKGLRFFARDGKHQPFEEVLVSQIIDDTLSLCRERFKNNGVWIEVQNPSPELKIFCRSVEISQVLLNLLNNAFDAVSMFDEKWIRLNVVERGDSVLLTVVDSGKGIPKSIAEKVLEPFFTTKPVGKGTGLGLSISRGIIVAHQGELFIDPDCKNTTFKICLPKKPSQEIDFASGPSKEVA